VIKILSTERVRGDSGRHPLRAQAWVPALGWIVPIYFYLLPGTPDTNRYSPPSAFTRPG
jgi:hypothetical protein